MPSPPSCSFLWRTAHSPLLRGRHNSSEAWGGFCHQPHPCCHHFHHHDVHQNCKSKAHHGCHHLPRQREWEESFPKVVISRQSVVIVNLTMMTHHLDLKTGLHGLLRSPDIWLHMSLPHKMYVVMSPFDCIVAIMSKGIWSLYQLHVFNQQKHELTICSMELYHKCNDLEIFYI